MTALIPVMLSFHFAGTERMIIFKGLWRFVSYLIDKSCLRSNSCPVFLSRQSLVRRFLDDMFKEYFVAQMASFLENKRLLFKILYELERLESHFSSSCLGFLFSSFLLCVPLSSQVSCLHLLFRSC
jgi:hypothetical protein